MALLKIICSDPWYTHLETGRKTVEGRKCTKTWSDISVGDTVLFERNSKDGEIKTFKAIVTGINYYRGEEPLREYLEGETLERALPGVQTIDEGVAVYLQWSTLDEIKEHKFMGISIRLC
jgi:ASC-1-like (ASCH) protein